MYIYKYTYVDIYTEAMLLISFNYSKMPLTCMIRYIETEVGKTMAARFGDF